MSTFYSLRVKNITRETPKAVSIEFEIPSFLRKVFQFEAGQYITLKKTIDGTEVRRAYSLCSTPHSGEIRVAIKEVEDGFFSVYANQKLTVGDEIQVLPPEGRFVHKVREGEHAYAGFVAGSGITPVMSILQTVLEKEPESIFVLTYGNKTPEDTIFLKNIKTLQNQYQDRLFVENVYSKTQEENAHFGHIEKSTVNYVLKNKYKELNFEDFYVCGPEGMITTVTETLRENNVDQDEHIHFELFNSSDTQEVPESVNTDESTEVTVILDDDTTTFTMSRGKTLLDAALAEGLDAPYSCQGGICASCICKVTEGKAKMAMNTVLTDSEIEEGLTLACQAHPTTERITIDFDDA